MLLLALVEVVHGNLEGPRGRVEDSSDSFAVSKICLQKPQRVPSSFARYVGSEARNIACKHLVRGSEYHCSTQPTSTSTFAAVEINALPLLARRRRRQLVCRRARRRALTPTVRLIGEAVVARCKCARCAVRPEAEDGGCTLPLPQPQRGRGGGAS